ncbi:MAG: hypothetical protein Fur0046_28350 [Cyanobacteria bacterium J069]
MDTGLDKGLSQLHPKPSARAGVKFNTHSIGRSPKELINLKDSYEAVMRK